MGTFACFMGTHSYEIVDTLPYLDSKGSEVAKVYVSKCQCCGKIINKRIYTSAKTLDGRE